MSSKLTPPVTVPRLEMPPLADEGVNLEEFRRMSRGEVAVELGGHDGNLGGIEVKPDGGSDEATKERVRKVIARRLKPAVALRLHQASRRMSIPA